MVPQNLTDERRTLGSILRRSFERLAEEVYSALAREGYPDVRPAHGAVFRHILPEGSRVTTLAQRAGMTKQSMGYLVDSLAELGYVELEPDPKDGRAKVVLLTERGRRAQEAAATSSERLEAVLAERVGREEYAAMRKSLERLADALESLP